VRCLFDLGWKISFEQVQIRSMTESKLAWGTKIATESKFRGPEKSCFFKGLKSQLWKT